jgi:hypothetical protein
MVEYRRFKVRKFIEKKYAVVGQDCITWLGNPPSTE